VAAEVFAGGRIITPYQDLACGTMIMENGTIRAVYDERQWMQEQHLWCDSRIHDVSGLILCPGFIDLHMHGAAGVRCTDGPEAVAAMADFLPSFGVTSFLPTIGAESRPVIETAIRSITEHCCPGADVPGLHLEGPFINVRRKGAQKEEAIVPPSVDTLQYWRELSQGHLALVSLAPELAGSDEVLQLLRKEGIVAAAGHTDATYDQTRRGFRHGISLLTHTFNGMRNFHHRDPGPVGAALTSAGIFCELIGDLVHVHPAAVAMLLACKGVEYVVLVTDGSEFSGAREGVHEKADGRKVTVAEGRVMLDDGTLAGSASTMIDNVNNMRRAVGMSWQEAVRMATVNPARVLGLTDRGVLSPACRADFLVLEPGGKLCAAYVGGSVYYRRSEGGTSKPS